MKGCFVPIFLKPHGNFNKIDLIHSLKEDGLYIKWNQDSSPYLSCIGIWDSWPSWYWPKKRLRVKNVHASVGGATVASDPQGGFCLQETLRITGVGVRVPLACSKCKELFKRERSRVKRWVIEAVRCKERNCSLIQKPWEAAANGKGWEAPTPPTCGAAEVCPLKCSVTPCRQSKSQDDTWAFIWLGSLSDSNRE